MRGGAQSKMLLCDDGNYYVVKFTNNPQGRRVLANELIGTRLASALGLPVPDVAVVYVAGSTIRQNPELTVHYSGRTEPCDPGLCFGSRYVADPHDHDIHDYLPAEMFGRVRNLHVFAGALVFDKWTCNADGRQALFSKSSIQKKFTVTLIDQGLCFNNQEWNFPDAPLRGVYAWNRVYAGVTGWESFEPWLSRLEGMTEQSLLRAVRYVPCEWFGTQADLDTLLEHLFRRRLRARELIEEFRKCSRNPFPNWRSSRTISFTYCENTI